MPAALNFNEKNLFNDKSIRIIVNKAVNREFF